MEASIRGEGIDDEDKVLPELRLSRVNSAESKMSKKSKSKLCF